jgi:hypothetical protein
LCGDCQERSNDGKWSRQALRKSELVWENCVADTGCSGGEKYVLLETIGLKSFIPAHTIVAN